jgi:beta-glucosidase
MSIETIDAIVRRILVEKIRLGLFERPYVNEDAIELQAPGTVALAREVARQGVVVLENKGVLPLEPRRGQRLAVIGPTADDPLALLCGYSFPVHLILNDAGEAAAQVVTPRAAFDSAFGAARVAYAQGCFIIEERKYGSPVFPGDVEKSTSLEQPSPVSSRTDLIPAAVACARAADVAVVCVGDLAGLFQTGTVGEGSDTDSLDLPGVQQQLLDAVVATGTPVVVVLMSGRPYNLGGLEEKVAAFVMAFAGGQEGGPALVDVLTGAAEPSGRLTVSVPKNVGAVPYYYNHKMKSAGTPIALHFGSRYPFGHGLGYTSFEFADPVLDAQKVEATGEIRLHFSVRNTGTRAGVAVPQLYVRDLVATVVRPVKELKAFGRVELMAGESARITFEVPTDMLSFTGMAGRRVVEPGEFELQVGASSADIRLRAVVEVTGAPRTLNREWRMESRCLIAR